MVASAAVVGSIVGIFVNAFLNKRSNHDIWMRDLRIRIYSHAIEVSEDFEASIEDYETKLSQAKPGAERELFAEETLAMLDALHTKLFQASFDVITFGSDSVGTAAGGLHSAALAYLMQLQHGDEVGSESEINKNWNNARVALRTAIRESLGITDT
jgi:hypothetical protein